MQSSEAKILESSKPMLQKAPVAGIGYLLKMLPVLIGRNARMWAKFRISLVMDILTNVAQASIFFFMGMLISNASNGDPSGYSTFLAVGLVANSIMLASLKGPYQSIANYYWFGRLETILLSPCPVGWAVFADVIWNYIKSLFTGVIFALLGWFFGAEIDILSIDFLLACCALFLGTIGVLGYGLISASTFSLLNAKGWSDPVSWLVGTLQGLITGVYFPITLLPDFLKNLALILPQTYTLDVSRYLLQKENYESIISSQNSPLQHDFTMLIMLDIILLTIGILAFKFGMKKARSDGSLSRWK